MSQRHRAGYLPWDRTGNRLLIQSSLGKNKPTNYDIPEQQFVYGRLTPLDPEKTADVMYEWNYHKNSQNKNIDKKKDLILTNKKAVKNLLHTAHQNYQFRKTQTDYQKVKQGSRDIKINLPQEGFTYGKPGELEDPIKLLISNDYGQTDNLMRHTMYSKKIENDSQVKRKISCHITKNHNIKKEATAKKMAQFEWMKQNSMKNHWKIPKFINNAQAKVDHTRKKNKNTDQGQFDCMKA